MKLLLAVILALAALNASAYDTMFLRKVNLMCGLPPLPPLGCRAICICDAYSNCGWTFVCN